jgi:hypothetical protein
VSGALGTRRRISSAMCVPERGSFIPQMKLSGGPALSSAASQRTACRSRSPR